jgi:putative membrane protein
MMNGWAGCFGNGFFGRGIMGGSMILIWLLVIGGIAYAIYWGVSGRNRNTHDSGNGNPISILKARYARGDISKQEFEQMKDELL